jgi:hypothetical protein
MSSTTSTSLSKEQKYLLNSKTFMENSGELTKVCLERSEGDIKFTTMLVSKYTSFVADWLKENWEVRDDIKEGIMKTLTAGWFIEKLRTEKAGPTNLAHLC